VRLKSAHGHSGPLGSTLDGSFIFKRALMPKKQRYGGLSPRYVRLVRDYLREVSKVDSRGAYYNLRLYLTWYRLVIYSKELDECPQPEPETINKSTFNALKAGLKVLKRKGIGRIWDLNPHQSFAALGITESTSRPASTHPPSNSDKQT
jgi:hypothetical protein